MKGIQMKGLRPLHIPILVSFMMLLVVAAAAAPPSPAAKSVPETQFLPLIQRSGTMTRTTIILDDGVRVTGLDGLTIGAISGTISSSVAITITRIDPPAVPLDQSLTPMGLYYDIQADRDLLTGAGNPFLLALPLAAGLDSSHLALAVLVPPEQSDDNSGVSPHWYLFRGVYDPVTRLLLTAINGLSAASYQVVLVDAPSQTPLTPSRGLIPTKQDLSATFEVFCAGYSSSAQCGTDQQNQVAAELSSAFDDFQDLLGFNDPQLPNRYYAYDPFSLAGYHSYYNIFLTPPPSSAGCQLQGQYTPNNSLEICLPAGSSITSAEVETIRHEYFHATQRGYPQVLTKTMDLWISDGTATAAQRSVTTMKRSSDYDLHPVDIPLTDTSTNYRYAAQDFFVYVGLKQGKGMEYLKPLFEKGGQTQDVVDVLGDGTHLPLYFDWVKNQFMEKSHTMENVLINPCSIQAEVVDDAKLFQHHWINNYKYDAGLLEPLTSVVIQIQWDGNYDVAFGWVSPTGTGSNPPATAALRYRFYQDGESGCVGVPDGPRLWPRAQGGVSTSFTYYLVISNIDPSQPYPYTVYFELSPLPPN